MNKALLAAVASVALVGASCSVQDFSPVVLEKPTISASFDLDAQYASITGDTLTQYYGKYSFKYGFLSDNRCNFDAFNFFEGTGPAVIKRVDNQLYLRVTGSDNRIFFPCELHANREYSLRYTSNTPLAGVALSTSNDSTEQGLQIITTVTDGTYYYATFTPNADKHYIRFRLNPNIDYVIGGVMVSEGSSSLPYQPYGYGFCFDTPVSWAGSSLMDMYVNDGVFMPRSSVLAFNYNDECKIYTDGIHFDFGGDTDLLNTFRSKFLGGYASGTSVGFEWDEDYDGDELIFVPVIDDYTEFAYCEFYIEDRYQAGYEDGYYAAERDNGIFNHAYYVSATDGTTTVTNYIDDSLLEWYSSANTQGLFDPYSLVSFFSLSPSATSYTITIQYGEVYASSNFPMAAYPLYVDVMADGVVEDTSLCPYLSITTYRGGSIRGNTLFAADFTTSYAGLAVGYTGDAVYNREVDTFNRISLTLPRNQSYADMRQIGVVSPYARGYVDGVTSRDGEVDDLTDRILALQNDLSQYQGKTYEQIYNLGVQAGLDENAQGAATFNSLFGNILTAPLTILNGLTDISFFGMPILTAILSLLMVAMALFLFKRFK